MRPRVEEVRIQGLGVIDEAVLVLSPGFTVVTGETGAGKTMVVTGLGLLFGGRADPARVRPARTRPPSRARSSSTRRAGWPSRSRTWAARSRTAS